MALAALTLAVGAWYVFGNDGIASNAGRGAPRADGPLLIPNPHGYAITRPVGETFTDGFETLAMDGPNEGKIVKVELVGAEGIELVGAFVAPPPRPMPSTQVIDSWPPVDERAFDSDSLVPAVGATIGSQEDEIIGWELLLGIRPTEEGKLFRRAVQVTYTVNGTTYVALLPAELTICTSPEFEEAGECQFADG